MVRRNGSGIREHESVLQVEVATWLTTLQNVRDKRTIKGRDEA